MKKEFSLSWRSSSQRRKQRKFRANAPLHIRTSFVSAHLEKSLRQKYKKRSLPLRVGDKVTILVGDFSKKSGKINRVDRDNYKVYVEGIEIQKKDGSKTFPPIEPSNVIITELNLEDKRRIKSGENKK